MRLVPHRPLPPYAHVPGQTPHPVSDPRGHSHGVAHEPVALDPLRWEECEEYLFGFDLFNAGFYWEAHEAWETCWHAVGRRGPVADLLKGLIRLAACGVKEREGRSDGMTSHSAAAARLFRAVGEQSCFLLGLDIPRLVRFALRANRTEKLIPTRDFPTRDVPPLRKQDAFVVEVRRRMSPEAKLAQLGGLWTFARDLATEGVRLRHPEYDEQQVKRAVARRMAGADQRPAPPLRQSG